VITSGHQTPARRRPSAPSSFTEKLATSAEASLRRDVLARLISDPLVSTRHIAVAVSADVVTLSGHVASQAQKEAADAAARRVKGVGRIANEVGVAVPAPSTTDASAETSDAPVLSAARPRMALSAAPSLSTPEPLKLRRDVLAHP
jgi:hypothetical protein